MMSTPAPDALKALAQISKFPRWADVDRMIEDELTAILDRIMGTRETADLHELRGRAKALREFQKLVRDAPDILAKLGQQAPL